MPVGRGVAAAGLQGACHGEADETASWRVGDLKEGGTRSVMAWRSTVSSMRQLLGQFVHARSGKRQSAVDGGVMVCLSMIPVRLLSFSSLPEMHGVGRPGLEYKNALFGDS